MSELPQQEQMTPEEAYERLQAWYQKKQQLDTLKTHEHLERVAISGFYFPNPREGANRMDLGGGFDLLLQAGFNYKVNEEDLDNVKATDIKKLKLPWDDLFVYKPSLDMKTYRALSKAQKRFVDGLLDIKPSSPQLKIVPQADREGQTAHAAPKEDASASPTPTAGPSASSASADDASLVVVLDATQAEPGQYYNDGDAWWVLNEDIEWDEVDTEDADLVARLDAELEQVKAADKPKKRGRPRKAKKA